MTVIREGGVPGTVSYAEQMAEMARKAREEQYDKSVKDAHFELKKVLNAIYDAAKKGQNETRVTIKGVTEEVDAYGKPLAYQMSLRDGIVDDQLHDKGFKTVVERHPTTRNLWHLVIRW